MSELATRIVTYKIKVGSEPLVGADIFFLPAELAPGDNFIGSKSVVKGTTDSEGIGSVTLVTSAGSYLNWFVWWDGSGGRKQFTVADAPEDLDLGTALKEAALAEDLRFSIASTTHLGAVKVDGTTITIAEDGTISAVGGGPGGTSDHGSLSGLSDDDHPQYFNQTRGDARYVQGNDARLTNSRAPSGPAGGVLSGSFPNPGFAVNMAEQSELDNAVTTLTDAIALKAPTASPTFTGTPAAPTAAPGTNSTQIANTAFVAAAVAALISAAPGALDTLDELAAAIGDDANFAATVTNALAGKEPTITGGTTAQYWRGDKSWQTLNAAAVGLGNVPNTNATQRANHSGTQTASTISDFASSANTLIAAASIASSQITGTKTSSFISDFASASLGTVLTGLGAGTNTAITSTDTLLAALAKLQNQISNVGGGGGASVSDTAYSISWDAVTTIAPSKNAVYDEMENRVVKNAGITGATKTKITYDAKGLVTAGADATTADIADSTNKRYVTDAQLAVIGSTSGTNTGDQFGAVAASKLLGRGASGGTGAAQEITIGSGLSMTGTTLSASGGGGGSGDVTKVGTPVNNQIGIWTGDGTIEGDANLTYDGTTLLLGSGKTLQGTIATGYIGNVAPNGLTLESYAQTLTLNAFNCSIEFKRNGAAKMEIDNTTDATDTALLVYLNGVAKRVSVGAADSGGSGYKVLRIPN